MPVFAADLLPDTTGRNLGNPSQRWNADFQSLNVAGSMRLEPVAGQVISPGGVIYAATVPATANANVTAEQLLLGYTVPAGLLNAAGKVLRCTMGGTYTTQAGQTPPFFIVAYFGTTAQVYNVACGNLQAAQTNNPWRGEFTITIIIPGSSASLTSFGGLVYRAAPPSSNIAAISAPYTSAGPVDLTVAQSFGIHCVFSTNTSPANVCTQNQLIVEVLN